MLEVVVGRNLEGKHADPANGTGETDACGKEEAGKFFEEVGTHAFFLPGCIGKPPLSCRIPYLVPFSRDMYGLTPCRRTFSGRGQMEDAMYVEAGYSLNN